MNGDDYEYTPAEMEMLLLDAARWRFMRRIACASEEEQDRVLQAMMALNNPTPTTPEQFDAAIDAAMKESL
jgi:hypothetical protein